MSGHPWDDGTIIKAKNKLHGHANCPMDTCYKTHDRWVLLPNRHTVDRTHGSILRCELRLQYEGIWSVPSCDTMLLIGRSDHPTSVLFVAE